MAVEYSKIGDNVGIDRISELLGGDAELLLNHVSKTIPKESLHLPGPDFVDRVVAQSDRSPRVLRSLQTIFGTGRLANTASVAWVRRC
jgi:class I fructose-bisphosphate aldolase